VEAIRPEVVDFIFDQGRAATDPQLRDADALDSKATQIFSAATVIIGLAGFSHQANAPLLSGLFGLRVALLGVNRLPRT
jgi:hypothetical protein